MAEVLMQFDQPMLGPGAAAYLPRVCGRVADDGLWEGWIEFVPVEGGGVLRTGRETEQPNRTDLLYWATGLSRVYLEGALQRASEPPIRSLDLTVDTLPAYEGPAPYPPRAPMPPAAAPRARPILDPFAVDAQGEDILRRELSALDTSHLLDIAVAYALPADDPATLRRLSKPTLVARIVAAVRGRRQAGGGRR